jgi:hypothetical protein
MTDPFAVLREELVGAAARQSPEPQARRSWWDVLARRLGWRSHPLAVLVGAVVITGSAAAGVIKLTGSRSQPLSGTVPGRVEAASVAGYRYTITVTPGLAAGEAFWNAFIAYNKHGASGSLGGGGGSLYPTATNPLFGGDGLQTFSPTPRGDTVAYVLTAPDVAAVRIGNRTIRTFSSPELPAADRAAVLFVPAGYPSIVTGWSPGQPVRSRVTFPSLAGRPAVTIQTIAALPLDRNGQVIATHQRMPYMPFAYFWQARSAVTPNIHEPAYHGATHPSPGVCELSQTGLRALRPEWGHVIKVIPRYPDAVGALFVACVDTEYYLHGWGLKAAVLLDARRPGRVLGPIPGAIPVSGAAGIVNTPAGLTARRVGNAWLVIDGGSGLAQRLQALRALRIGKLDLNHVSSGR